ncbi:MAG TPA: CHRD domain-containing protein [Gemmatimonadales bacterium]|nr:CHRD domain-containing protein [Gemmatimonadales bacterium]
MKKRISYALLAPSCLVAFAGPGQTGSAPNPIRLRARLTPVQEVPSTLSSATGEWMAEVDPTRTSVTFTMTYSDLSTPVLFSHIHFGQPGVNGAVMVFFCNNSSNGPQPRPCPTPGGTVSGTFTAADVQAVTTQGIRAGSLDDVLAAISTGRTYVNIHSMRSPGGEIRGRVRVEEDEGQQ